MDFRPKVLWVSSPIQYYPRPQAIREGGEKNGLYIYTISACIKLYQKSQYTVNSVNCSVYSYVIWLTLRSVVRTHGGMIDQYMYMNGI